MLQILLSLVLGMLPEVLYFTLFLINTKKIKDKKFKLFIGISIAYIFCIIFNKYKIIYYVAFIFLLYAVLKLIYKEKTQIIDIFVISISSMYLSLVGFLCSLFINNNYTLYFVMMLINRCLLFLPFIFKNNFFKLYKIYCGLWNRDDSKKKPIKSLTLRNISLITLNCFIFLLNLGTIYVINTFE
mgnify:CR=1 FL=1